MCRIDFLDVFKCSYDESKRSQNAQAQENRNDCSYHKARSFHGLIQFVQSSKKESRENKIKMDAIFQ